MRTRFFVAVVITFAMVATALAQAPDLASMVGVWKGTASSGVPVTLTVNSVGPKAKGYVQHGLNFNDAIETIILKGDKVFVKFEGGDMTLTVNGGKASGKGSSAGSSYNRLNGVSLTKQ